MTFAPLQPKRPRPKTSVTPPSLALQPSSTSASPHPTPVAETPSSPDRSPEETHSSYPGHSIEQLPIHHPTRTSSAPVMQQISPLASQPDVAGQEVQQQNAAEISGAVREVNDLGQESQQNHTGLPDTLKTGIERLSGISLDDVQVHYNSSRPAGVEALAYTQGTQIHVGPDQQKHLAHETWHVVQQKQGRVQPTTQAKGIAINDDEELEREAETMGEKGKSMGAVAVQRKEASKASRAGNATSLITDLAVIQRVSWDRPVGAGKTIWSPDVGRAFEKAYGANIGGNYPVVDDFRGNIATSLKAMDLINNYQGDNGPGNLRDALNGHLNDLVQFRPVTYGGITIKREEVKFLYLLIAIPPKASCPKVLLDEIANFAGRKVDPKNIGINQAREKVLASRNSTEDEKQAALEELKNPTQLGIGIVERNDLPWGKSAGTLYEEKSGANIGGNFPVIDDFQKGTGIVTSLKTINIVENYATVKALETTVDLYIEELAAFNGRKWPLGTNHKAVDKTLVEKGADGKEYIVVDGNDIKGRVLKIAIPQIKGQKVYDSSGHPLDWDSEEGEILRDKYQYMGDLHGKTVNGVSLIVEGVE